MSELSPEDLTALATAVAIEVSQGKDAAEIMVLRNIALQISQTLFCVYSQKCHLESIEKSRSKGSSKKEGDA